MRTRYLLLIAAAAVVAAAAVAIASAGVATKVTIKNGGPTQFSGTVSASDPACEKGRTVTLMYTPDAARQSDEQPVGEDTTDKHGNWSIDGDFFAGMYGADAKSKTVHGTKCKSGKSKRKHY